MTVNHKKSPAVRIPPVPMMIAAVSVLILFLGWQFYTYFVPHSPPAESKPMRPEFKEVNDWITQKAKESQGDINRLSKQDQQMLSDKTRGNGAMVLKNIYDMSQH